jgi:protein SFI1
MRYLRDTLLIWQKRLQKHRQNEGTSQHRIIGRKSTSTPVDRAVQFLTRPRSSVLSAAFKTWQGKRITQQHAYAYATRYYSTQVLDRMLLTWRLALRERLKIAKSARKAHNTLALRRVWYVWRSQLERHRREALLKTFETRRLKNIFFGIISSQSPFKRLHGSLRVAAAHCTGANM